MVKISWLEKIKIKINKITIYPKYEKVWFWSRSSNNSLKRRLGSNDKK